MSIIFDDYGQPDYEAMILERQEAWELAGDCDNDCSHCYYSEVCSYADYEAMILERQEDWELAGDCDNDCSHCYYSEVCSYAEEGKERDD